MLVLLDFRVIYHRYERVKMRIDTFLRGAPRTCDSTEDNRKGILVLMKIKFFLQLLYFILILYPDKPFILLNFVHKYNCLLMIVAHKAFVPFAQLPFQVFSIVETNKFLLIDLSCEDNLVYP
jgi:hypothetical protein